MFMTTLKLQEDAATISREISELIQSIETDVLLNGKHAKECKELNILKEKCCSQSVTVVLTACQGIIKLVEKKVLARSQTISTLISLLPSVIHYNALVSTIGKLLLLNLKELLAQSVILEHEYFYNEREVQHPFVIILQSDGNKYWFEIYSFMYNMMTFCDDIKLEHKLCLLRPIFHHVFWCPEWRGSQLQTGLFNYLLLKISNKVYLDFALEVLMLQDFDINYCMFLKHLFMQLLGCKDNCYTQVVEALTPTLAEAIKWIIHNGHNPTTWISLLHYSIQVNNAAGCIVLCILTNLVMETSSYYINEIVQVCKSIIFGASCNKYMAYRFIAVSLNWLINPSLLTYPLNKTLQDVLSFVPEIESEWNDQTSTLKNNEYFKKFGNTCINIKFALDMVQISSSWCTGSETLTKWLKNVKESNEQGMQFNLYSYLCSIVLCENDKVIINLCFEILMKLLDKRKEISFILLCILFYKLARETEPRMQKNYLLFLPKLAVKKENIPLILGIIESLKSGKQNIMLPLVIQLFLVLWKTDSRTYTYLHRVLHDNSTDGNDFELNLSKAVALREICRIAPDLHGKDIISVINGILNECSDQSMSGLPSAVTIEAVTELCKAHVIDISGTWDAIQPKLSTDSRSKVIINLCKFFGQIPSLNPPGEKKDQLMEKIVPMLWEYTFRDDDDVVKEAFKTLSKFEIENQELKLLPRSYRGDEDLRKEHRETCSRSFGKLDDILSLPYVPAQCWLRFLEQISERHQEHGGKLLGTIVERELNSLPRGIFYLPPEKSEPLTYSYLPQQSVCRAFVEQLQQHSKMRDSHVPGHLTEVIHVLSEDYSKTLPPLDWGFLSYFTTLNSKHLLLHTLGLLMKQGWQSKSAKMLFENYLSSVDWNYEKVDEIVFLYGKIINLCKAVSCNIFHEFCGKTLMSCLQYSLENNSHHFHKILDTLTVALKMQNINYGHKTAIAKHLENILPLIPYDHAIMNSYSLCATEFPLKSIDNITLPSSLNTFENEWLHRAILIRYSIAMRPDISNPLVWFNQFIETSAILTRMKNFILYKIISVIRARRLCNHLNWMEELMWKIHFSITSSEANEVTLLLLDIFVSAVIVLSGYDTFFADVAELASDNIKKIEVFQQSIVILMNFPEWTPSTSKFTQWLQNLLKWKHLPSAYLKAFIESLLVLGFPNQSSRFEFLRCIYNSPKCT